MNNLPNKTLFRIGEVAKIFGVTDRTVRNWIKNGTITAVKVGGGVWIKKEAIEECLVEVEPVG